MKSPRALLFGSALVLVGLAQPGFTIGAEPGLEEVVVTAQKREERLVDVPMSITAISGTDLAELGVRSIQDLSFAVPGVATREDGPGSYTIFMRGLSNQYGNGALVGVYLDEAPLSLTGFDQMDARPFDLDRVEVLKGPQGTLYGQGAVAGAVRYITKDPVLNAYQGSIEASAAMVQDGSGKRIETGMVNLPLAANVFGVRLAATKEDGGGWQNQPQAHILNGNGQDLLNARLKALWKPADALALKAMFVVFRDETKLGLGYENPDRTVPVAIDPARVLIPKKFDYNLYNLDGTYDFGRAELLSSTSYIHHTHHYPFSYFGGLQTIYAGALQGTDARYVDAKQFSEEVRLTSRGSEALKWTVGGFYRNLLNDFFALYDTLYAGTLYPNSTYIADDTYNQLSLFADASYQLTPRLALAQARDISGTIRQLSTARRSRAAASTRLIRALTAHTSSATTSTCTRAWPKASVAAASIWPDSRHMNRSRSSPTNSARRGFRPTVCGASSSLGTTAIIATCCVEASCSTQHVAII